MSSLVHLPDPPNLQLFGEEDQRCGRCGITLPITGGLFWYPGTRLLHIEDGRMDAWVPEIQAMGISFEGDVVECSVLQEPEVAP